MFFGLTSMILVGASWTIYGIAMGKAPKQKIDISYLLFISTLTGALVSLLIGLADGVPTVSTAGFVVAFLSLAAGGIFNYYQLDFMSKAMQKGPNGIIWTVCQSGFIFPFFMGILFFHQKVNMIQNTGFLIILLSLFFFGKCKENGVVSGKWKILTFLAFLMTGLSQSFQNLPSYFPESENLSSVWRTCFFSCGMSFGAVFTGLKSSSCFRTLREQSARKIFWMYILMLEVVEVLVSYFLLFPGMDRLAQFKIGAVAFPVMVCSCLISFDLFSLFILREKHKLLQWIALFLCIAGVICLSINKI